MNDEGAFGACSTVGQTDFVTDLTMCLGGALSRHRGAVNRESQTFDCGNQGFAFNFYQVVI